MWSEIISRSKPRPSTVCAQRRRRPGAVPGPKFGTFTPIRTGQGYPAATPKGMARGGRRRPGLRFGGGHHPHRWVHAKAAPRAVDLAELGRGQRRRVLRGVAEVEDGDAAARLEHTHDLADRRGPA